jgi:hypothetical protein
MYHFLPLQALHLYLLKAIKRMEIEGQPRQSGLIQVFISINKSWAWQGASAILATQEAQIGGSQFRPAWAKMQDSISKIMKAQRAG